MSSLKMDLNGKVALVTGGTSGIGKAIVEAMLDAGASVATGSRTPGKIDEARKELLVGRDPRKLLVTRMDVADPKSFEEALEATVKQFGRVDILVNNAGTNLKKPTVDVTDEEHRRLFDINYFGPFAASQAFCRQIIRQNAADPSKQGGVIVNTCSVTSFLALSEVTTYAASKGALLALTRQLAVEWPRKYGIRVNAIAPGFVPADQNRQILKSGDRGRRILENTPLERFGDPEEMAGAVVLLCSEAGRFINGECINIDGGFMIHGVSDSVAK
ncbi:MAG: SDR family NAD(P)-dependent oxidoreductase [Phycisphaerales bacterium]